MISAWDPTVIPRMEGRAPTTLWIHIQELVDIGTFPLSLSSVILELHVQGLVIDHRTPLLGDDIRIIEFSLVYH